MHLPSGTPLLFWYAVDDVRGDVEHKLDIQVPHWCRVDTYIRSELEYGVRLVCMRELGTLGKSWRSQ